MTPATVHVETCDRGPHIARWVSARSNTGSPVIADAGQRSLYLMPMKPTRRTDQKPTICGPFTHWRSRFGVFTHDQLREGTSVRPAVVRGVSRTS